jgi:hypothetical protein
MIFGETYITSGVLAMNQIQLTLTIGYLLMTGYFLSNWLIFFQGHPASTPEDNFLSVVMFLLLQGFGFYPTPMDWGGN